MKAFKILQKIKSVLKYFTYPDPNSPEGLRLRADRLVKEDGYSYQHPYVSALLKQADLKEDELRKKRDA